MRRNAGFLHEFASDCAARRVRSDTEAAVLPDVCDSSFMKDCVAFSMVATCQIGFHSSGWKSENEKQMRSPGLKRPEGVTNMMPGGLKG